MPKEGLEGQFDAQTFLIHDPDKIVILHLMQCSSFIALILISKHDLIQVHWVEYNTYIFMPIYSLYKLKKSIWANIIQLNLQVGS